jgi:hypothetical protein
MQEISKLVDDSIPAKKSKFSGHLTWLWIFFRKAVLCVTKNLVKESCLKKKLQIN